MSFANVFRSIVNRVKKSKFKIGITFFLLAHRLRYRKDYKQLSNILSKIKIAGGNTFNLQAYKLYCLKRILETYKPASIIELGGGSSTAIFAEYARKNCIELYSYDESEFWINTTKELIGLSENDTNIHLIYAQRIFVQNHDYKQIKYDTKYSKSCDLVFIDGPQLNIGNIKYKDAVNSDIFEIADIQLPKLIVVDIRKATVDEIRKRLHNYYEVKVSDIINRNVNKELNYYSIFSLK